MLRRSLPLLLSLLAFGCGGDVLDEENDVVVLNDSACAITIYVDGREAFVVPAGSDMTLDDIGAGRHVFEALDSRDGVVIRRTVDLSAGEDYYLIIDDC